MIEVSITGITLLQDSGRAGLQSIGVGSSGAWDQINYRLLAKLLGETNPTVFEIIRGRFEFHTSSKVSLAVIGAAVVESNGQKLSLNTLLEINADSKILITPSSDSPVYLGISGLSAQKILGSSATDTLSGLGPKQVTHGEKFEIAGKMSAQIGSFIQKMPRIDPVVIRFVRGPHFQELPDLIEVQAIARTGVRFQTKLNSPLNTLPSFPVFPGVIQLTPNGELIALGVDCGTTGGYPAVGVIIESDLAKLARLTQSQKIRLIEISPDEANTISKQLAKEVAKAVINPANFGAW